VTARSTPRAIVFGIAAGTIVALAYGLLSEPIEFTLGLFVVGIVGGWLIGNAVSYGAWHGKTHEAHRPLQWAAVAIAVVAWIAAVYLAFVMSQVFVPAASTPLISRIGIGGLFEYLAGLDLVPIVHIVALALMALMAWRGAR